MPPSAGTATATLCVGLVAPTIGIPSCRHWNSKGGTPHTPTVKLAAALVGTATVSGWLTIEGGDLSVEEHSKRLDLIIGGK